MPSPCPTCRPKKTKIVFDINKARNEAKKLAIENEKTFAIYKTGNALSYTDADNAREKGYTVIEFLSYHI